MPSDAVSHDCSGGRTGLVLIVSGPSGSGKTTLVNDLVRSKEFPITLSISATTRSPRPGEHPNRDYRFVSEKEFLSLEQSGELLESARVHNYLYGTPRQPVEDLLAQGLWVLLEIDVEGHRQVKNIFDDAVSFFIRTASLEDLERRLRLRDSDSDETIARRMRDAEEQLAEAVHYDFQVINESLEQATRSLRTLLHGLKALRGI